ncbi:DUF2796 domain-containing protein [bacterium]|jgi:hypothetical protein|nr:DUF2796 domain-containing protein [bacterium]
MLGLLDQPSELILDGNLMKKNLLLILSVLATSNAIAEETRQLNAHEHGLGKLNIALDGKEIRIELHAPGADIVGFEYPAVSQDDHIAIGAAVGRLAQPLALFVLPKAAECTVLKVHVGLESEEDYAEDAQEHVDHTEDDEEEHVAHEEEHSDEAGHTEFHAEYRLNCDKPAAISQITFAYFDTFANARELDVQIVTEVGAQAFEVERSDPELDLRGVF